MGTGTNWRRAGRAVAALAVAATSLVVAPVEAEAAPPTPPDGDDYWRPVYYTDRTNPDRYDATTGASLYAFPPDLYINCGNGLAPCTTPPDYYEDPDWNIDDIVWDGDYYTVQKAGLCSDPKYFNQTTCEAAHGSWGETATGAPVFANFQFDRYEAFLDEQDSQWSPCGRVVGTKELSVGQLQPPNVNLKIGPMNSESHEHLVGDYQAGNQVAVWWPWNNNVPGNWGELKLLGVWRYRVEYIDRGTVTYPVANTADLTNEPYGDTGANTWDDVNTFYWTGSTYAAACDVPKTGVSYSPLCKTPGTPGTTSRGVTDQVGYSDPGYQIPADEPTLAGAVFEYYKVWIDGQLVTDSPGVAHPYKPGNTIDIMTIVKYGGDIEIQAVWKTYQVVFHALGDTTNPGIIQDTDAAAGRNCPLSGRHAAATCAKYEPVAGGEQGAIYWVPVDLSLEDAFGDDQGWPADPTRTGYRFTGWYLTEAAALANDTTQLNNGPGGLTPAVNNGKTLYDSVNGYLWYDDNASNKYYVKRQYEFWAGWEEESAPEPTPTTPTSPTIQPPTPEPPEPPEPEAPEPEGQAIVEAPEPMAPGLASAGNNLIPYSPVFVVGFLFCAVTCLFASRAVRREEEDAPAWWT
jgi:uncharacterized repeat protein (TIGR02543 family)